MKLPKQVQSVLRNNNSVVANHKGVQAQGICTTACSLLQTACNKLPFVSSSVCQSIYNCCTGACGS